MHGQSSTTAKGLAELKAREANWETLVASRVHKARFATKTTHSWWERMGRKRHRSANRLLVATNGGRSNQHDRLWKVALRNLANDLRIGHQQIDSLNNLR